MKDLKNTKEDYYLKNVIVIPGLLIRKILSSLNAFINP